MQRKQLAKRIGSMACAVFFLLFGADLGPSRFCLGDLILTGMGLPAWSKGTQGLHYPGIIAVIGLTESFCFFSATTKDPKKTMACLILGSIVLVSILNFLLKLL